MSSAPPLHDVRSTIIVLLASIALPHILNNEHGEEAQWRADELATAIVSLRDAEPELSSVDVVTGVLEHRVACFGLRLAKASLLALRLARALEKSR